MSGYFVLTRAFFDEVAHSLSAIGFKVLVDILASAKRPVRVGEVGYQFRTRAQGDSKLDIVVELEYLELLFDKVTGGWIPPSYFPLRPRRHGRHGLQLPRGRACCCASGTWSFSEAQAIGALLTVAFNFFLNNAMTFRSARMHGAQIVKGLLFVLRGLLGCPSGAAGRCQRPAAVGAINWGWCNATSR